VPLAGVVVRKFTLRRFADEFRRDGARLFYKVWRKLIVRGDENPDDTYVSLSTVAQAAAAAQSNVVRWCRQNRVAVFHATDLNAPPLRSWLLQQHPDVGVFTGGGLVSAETQSAFRIGIINPHMGHLPRYRGMDVVQWPILEGHLGNVGLTAHLMDAGLDTGPIVQHAVVDPLPYRSLGALRNAVQGLMPLILVDSALGLGSGRLRPVAQRGVEPLYYYIHDKLLRIVDLRLQAGTGKAADSDTCTLFDRFLAEFSSAPPQI
jgi:methionyl-tRNA formyltransferase